MIALWVAMRYGRDPLSNRAARKPCAFRSFSRVALLMGWAAASSATDLAFRGPRQWSRVGVQRAPTWVAAAGLLCGTPFLGSAAMLAPLEMNSSHPAGVLTSWSGQAEERQRGEASTSTCR